MLGSSSPRAEINYQEIFESVPGQYLILMPNADYTILAVSNNYLRVTNTTREQIVGKSLLQVFPPNPEDPDISKSLGIIRESLLRVLHSKTEDNMPVIKYDIRKVLGEGGRFEERYWSSINTPVLNPDGTIKYIIHRTEDVTELALLKEKSVSEKHRSSDEMQRMAIEIFNKAEEIKRAQEKLRAASEERALLEQSLEEKRKIIELSEKFRKQQVDFIDTLCHEIRNPLSAVMLSVDLQVETLTELNSLMNSSSVAAELHKSEIAIKLKKAHEFAAAISLGVKHQKLIVDNVLDLSRLISGKFELNPVPVNISIVFDSMIEIFRPQIQARGLEFCSAIPGEPLWVKADATRLMQVISNILSNALKFTAKGHIAFNVKYEPIADQKIELQVSVNDTGIGISEEQKLRIFQPYEKASRRTAIEHGSSGLGLSITQKLIEKMGGHIHISSKEGEGSKFEFTANLERLNPEETAKIRAEELQKIQIRQESLIASPQVKGKRSVLIVEDDRMNRKLLAKILEKYDCKCSFAVNGVEAVNVVSRTSFDIILMDIEMPVLDGIKATQKIRDAEKASGRHVSIIGCSGYTREGFVRQAMEAGMDAYINKPFERKELIEILQRFAPLENAVLPRSSSAFSSSEEHSTESEEKRKAFDSDVALTVSSMLVFSPEIKYEAELDQAALASQRSIAKIKINETEHLCKVVYAKPDGNCGFTASKHALVVQGHNELASVFERQKFIELVTEVYSSPGASDKAKRLIEAIFAIDGIANNNMESWANSFKSSGYWVQEPHFRFLSYHFNIRYNFYYIGEVFDGFVQEPSYESIYEGRDPANTIGINLSHVSTMLKDRPGANLNHFDAIIVAPTLEQLLIIQRINASADSTIKTRYFPVEKAKDIFKSEKAYTPIQIETRRNTSARKIQNSFRFYTQRKRAAQLLSSTPE